MYMMCLHLNMNNCDKKYRNYSVNPIYIVIIRLIQLSCQIHYYTYVNYEVTIK